MGTQWPTPPDIWDTIQTSEAISGFRAVNVSQSGYLQVAMPAVSGRMPAIGVVVDNYASGVMATFKEFGSAQGMSGMCSFGTLGRTVWIGRSGHLAQMSGSWLSGGFLSGDITQRAGIALNSGGLRIHMELTVCYSGPQVYGPTGTGIAI